MISHSGQTELAESYIPLGNTRLTNLTELALTVESANHLQRRSKSGRAVVAMRNLLDIIHGLKSNGWQYCYELSLLYGWCVLNRACVIVKQTLLNGE